MASFVLRLRHLQWVSVNVLWIFSFIQTPIICSCNNNAHPGQPEWTRDDGPYSWIWPLMKMDTPLKVFTEYFRLNDSIHDNNSKFPPGIHSIVRMNRKVSGGKVCEYHHCNMYDLYIYSIVYPRQRATFLKRNRYGEIKLWKKNQSSPCTPCSFKSQLFLSTQFSI